MKTSNELVQSLQQAGFRITPQRIAICDFLISTNRHPTAMQVFETIKEDYPSLSLATVYNTMDALVAHGQVNNLGEVGDSAAHFDANLEPHMHLACIHCQKIIDVPADSSQWMDEEVLRSYGYQLLGVRVMVYGICPECQKEIHRKDF